jgi:CHAT domain-containing protein
VTVHSRVVSILRMLHFQLSKFRLGPDYVRQFETSLLEAARAHLYDLYQELIAPIRDRLDGDHIIVVPHDVLHYIPFHALFDGEKYLIDDFTISYAPSASVYSLCSRGGTPEDGESLILGVPDDQAPFIEHEVRAVAEVVPRASTYLGSDATQAVLREKGRSSRFVHIATHGFFRKDNPMFSGIRLGDSYLSLYDLYQMDLPVELVVLSGCATGLNVVAAGDELLGLARGLIYAGARSLVLSLWDVNDESSADLMRAFYSSFTGKAKKSHALRAAMLQVREAHPHPYYWAPFLLVGDPR